MMKHWRLVALALVLLARTASPAPPAEPVKTYTLDQLDDLANTPPAKPSAPATTTPGAASMSAGDAVVLCAIYGTLVGGMLFVAVFFELRQLRRRISELQDENRRAREHERKLVDIRIDGLAKRLDASAPRIVIASR
jgi:hypothetical protein